MMHLLKRRAPEGLRIDFTQQGGIIGGVWGTTVDARQLSPDEAQEVEHLMQESGLLNIPRFRFPYLVLGADTLQYDIKVVWGKRRRHIRLDDTQVPSQARPLLSYLSERAMKTR